MTVHRRAIVIGLDAADQHLLRTWADQGELPGFAQLFKKSAWGLTKSPPGQYAGSIWPSFFTGASPARHGRYFHTQFVPQTYGYREFLPTDLKHPPFWKSVSDAGKRVIIIDVPKAPIDSSLNGIQILDWGTHDPESKSVRISPADIEKVVRTNYNRGDLVLCDRFARDPGGLKKTLLERVELKTEMIEHFLTRHHSDLFVAVFADSHCAGHQFWHLHDPDHPRHDARSHAMLGDALKDVYISLDQGIARILPHIDDDPDTTLIVFSSHGIGPHYDGTFMLNDIVTRLQGGTARPRGIKTSLRRLWRALPGNIRRKVRAPVIRATATDKLKFRTEHAFFAVKTNDNCGGIRLNVVEREAHGRVRRGEEYDTLCARIREDLLDIINLDTGKPIVRDVLKTRDLFTGPQIDELPDLNVVWNREQPIRRIFSPKIGALNMAFPGHRTGDHRSLGLICACGRQIPPGPLAAPISIMDIAPTCAAILGVTELDSDGSVIPEIYPGQA
ncbi:MAG: alkaline phosphatase family protein [Gammaproteobacteria bacterium]|nr:alkaline phosphatase family protein [Gammaproteobacteria bacterium]